MQEFIIDSNPHRALYFFESMESLEDKLEQILKVRQEAAVREAVAPFVQLTPISLRDLVGERMFPEPQKPSEPTAAKPASAEPEPPKKKSAKSK